MKLNKLCKSNKIKFLCQEKESDAYFLTFFSEKERIILFVNLYKLCKLVE